jgi:hypothetical protein
VAGPDERHFLRACRVDEVTGRLDDPAHMRNVDAARGIPAVLVQEVVLVVDEEERRTSGDEFPPDGREGVDAGAVCWNRRALTGAD